MLPVLVFGLIATGIYVISYLLESVLNFRVALTVAPYELLGAALGLLLVLRTNSGYERWWEARKLWGGIVNQSRNLVISATAYGPDNEAWRKEMIGWAAVFPHVARASLRGEAVPAQVENLIGKENAEAVAAADHMPIFVVLKLAHLLHHARTNEGMDGFAFMQIDRERALLIDHIGACERILKTPLPRVYSIKIRRFIFLFLCTLPIALLHRLNSDWLVPLITMMVAYPLLALDQIGVEMENPFSTKNMDHLPLDDISATIERNLRAL